SAVVEPIFAVLGAAAVGFFMPILPYALAFAAGAMVLVVIEEVIPETQQEELSDIPILGFVLGFTIMMILDVGLGSRQVGEGSGADSSVHVRIIGYVKLSGTPSS